MHEIITIKTDLPKRKEERYIPFSPDFIGLLKRNLERHKFSDNEVVQTIYFSNDDHSLPFLLTLKTRRYLPAKHKSEPRTFRGKWFFDIKERRDDLKYKTRIRVTLKEALDIANKKYGKKIMTLRPFFMLKYKRQHYVYNDGKGVYARFSIDKNTRYFYFDNKQKNPVLIGTEPYPRLEIKTKGNSKKLIGLIEKLKSDLKVIPVISKKGQAYNLLCKYMYKKDSIFFLKELKECEIESKLVSKTESVFPLVFNALRSGKYAYKIPSHFKHVFESSSINQYYKNSKESFKVLLRPDYMSVVRKGKVKVCSNSENLKCILKRSETKQRFENIQPEILKKGRLQGELYRYRKAFWVENPETRRIYHISFDICQTSERKLYEMEVEYTGRFASSVQPNVNEQEIVDDIARITKILLSLSGDLRESTLTKREWLLKGSNR
ncbi:hypothetical protein KKC62_02185 [Patescibacteria group bacterium]|nr:hypothetical protein [Patescibacteria group bacterium]MBU1952988.1 hypothetical protein [Patescibacteria group bacterium]